MTDASDRLTAADRRIVDQARELEDALSRIAGLRERYGEKDPAALLVFLSGEARSLLGDLLAIVERRAGT